MHAKARQVSWLAARFSIEGDEEEANLCPWCNFPFDTQQFPLWVDNNKLGELGSGFPLFYEFFQALVMMIFVWTLFCLYALIDNYNAGNEDEHDDSLRDHFAMSGSIAAHGTSGEPSSIQSWILAVTSVFIVAFFVLMQFRRKALAK